MLKHHAPMEPVAVRLTCVDIRKIFAAMAVSLIVTPNPNVAHMLRQALKNARLASAVLSSVSVDQLPSSVRGRTPKILFIQIVIQNMVAVGMLTDPVAEVATAFRNEQLGITKAGRTRANAQR